jgi:transcriptional regulator with XRE-family HTH domain
MSLSSEVATPASRYSPGKRAPLPAEDLPPAPPAPPTETAPPPIPEDSAALVDSPTTDGSDITRLSGRVRFARLLAKLSKAELARRVGVCLSAAVQWELPKGTSPTVNNLVKIATIAGVAFEWLATGRGSPKLPGPLQVLASADDLEFETRLLVTVRAIARDHREVVIDFARSMANR